MSRYEAAHRRPHGPGDCRPTALQIVEDGGLISKLTDKIVFITGANQGIGLETARALHATGATVYLGVRDIVKSQQAVKDIMSSPDPTNKAAVHLIKLSLDSFDSIRVMATPEGRTVDGFETQFGINHLGHFLLFQLVKPVLLAASTASFQSRVVSVSSYGHRSGEVRFDDFNFEKAPCNQWAAYGQSKTANIYLTNEVERRYGYHGLRALSLHPGGVLSNLQQHIDPETRKAWMNDPAALNYTKSAAQGAATSVYAAVSKEWEGRGGKYLSNCVVQGPVNHPAVMGDDGYAAWAYDEEKAARLWRESCKLVGVADDVLNH